VKTIYRNPAVDLRFLICSFEYGGGLSGIVFISGSCFLLSLLEVRGANVSGL
jgi:hypothetical protein